MPIPRVAFLQRRVLLKQDAVRACGRARVCVGVRARAEGHEADGTCLISLSQRNETGTGLTNLRARLMARDTAPTQTGGDLSPLQR